MAHVLIIESRDLQEYQGGRFVLDLAGDLREAGDQVTLFLVENGVLAARPGNRLGAELGQLKEKGVEILAEEISLQARGIRQVAEGIQVSNMDRLADLIVQETDKVLWY